MATLSVWRFDTATGADEAIATLERLASQRLIAVHDAATVSWPTNAKVADAFSGQQPHLVSTNLSHEQAKALREAFAV
jgi:uncharacterized membrane protein